MSEPRNKQYNAERAEFIFGQKMEPCPNCGGYHFAYRVPIRIDVDNDDNAREWIKKLAIAYRNGPVMEGIAYIVCCDCQHRGPEFNCSHLSYDDVMKSEDVANEIKRLWNSQTKGTSNVR